MAAPEPGNAPTTAGQPPALLGHPKARGMDLPVSGIFPQPLTDYKTGLGTSASVFHVCGELSGNQVVVRRSGDIALLSNMGFFGTRQHARSGPPGARKRRNDDSLDSHEEEEEEETEELPCKRRRVPEIHSDVMDTGESSPSFLRPPALLDNAEPLILSCYEAFFLVHSVGMLRVFSQAEKNSRQLSMAELWNHFASRCHVFPFHYSVYLFYRAKGWVPKHGLRVGADFTLYPQGPPFFHAVYSVRIQVVGSDTLAPLTSRESKFDVKRLLMNNRVANKVDKKLVLCYVIVPEIRLDLTTPTSVGQLKVKEVLVERFHPERL